jgi:hypothetical protein
MIKIDHVKYLFYRNWQQNSLNLGGVWFRNMREWDGSVPDFENGKAPFRVWKQERSHSDFLFG